MRHLSEEELSELADGGGDVEVAHLATCPECRGRLDVWRGVRSRLAAGGPVPDGRRDEAVAAAMEASSSSPGGRRSRPSRRVAMGAGLAAAAAVALGIGLTHTGGSGNAHVSSKAPTTVGPASGSPAASGGAGSGSSYGASAAGAGAVSPQSGAASLPVPVAALGPLDGPPSLVAAVQRALRVAVLSPPSPSRYAVSRCPVPPRGLGSVKPPLILVATAEYRSAPAVVYVYQVGGQRRAYVFATRTCSLLVEEAV